MPCQWIYSQVIPAARANDVGSGATANAQSGLDEDPNRIALGIRELGDPEGDVFEGHHVADRAGEVQASP